MIILLSSVLISMLVSSTASSDFFIKGDPCSKFDSCFAKPQLRTCSCEDDCQFYGTCCHDFKKEQQDLKISPYSCYSRRTAFPVFAKRSCDEDYKGHIDNRLACHDDDEDIMDVTNNLLVTSHKTKITYWNKHCAACSHELMEDLEFWNIEVFCPQHKSVDRSLIRRNLTFDQDKEQWGLEIDGKFLQCIVKYAPPLYADEVKLCSLNLISSCPDNYTSDETVKLCSKYYGERKVKDADLYYKNIHCAICNGVNVTNLDCPGMMVPRMKAEDNVEETDFKDMVEEVFMPGTWPVKFYKCSEGFAYDAMRTKCRRDPSLLKSFAQIPNSSYICRPSNLLAFVVLCVSIFMLKKYA